MIERLRTPRGRGRAGHGPRPRRAAAPGVEGLEGRIALTAPTTLPAADLYQTLVPVSPGFTNAHFQFITAGSYQAVSSLTLTVDVNKTGLFDMGFQAVAESNSPLDAVHVRYQIDGHDDPNDPIDYDGTADDLVQAMKGNSYGDIANLSLTRQITLTPGTHTVTILVMSEASATGQNGHDLILFDPVLHLTGYNRINGQAAADGYQTQTPANPDTPGDYAQEIAPGSWQTVSSLTVDVDADKTGTFDMGFLAVARSISSNVDEISVRYLIDGQPDPNDVALTNSAADLVEDLTQPRVTLSLTRQLTLSPGVHAVSVQMYSQGGVTHSGDQVVDPVLHLTGFNRVDSALSAIPFQDQTLPPPASPGNGVQAVTAGSWQTVSDLYFAPAAGSVGSYDVAFQATLRSNSASDQAYVRILIDGHLDQTSDLSTDLIQDMVGNSYGDSVNVSLTRQLTVSVAIHHLQVQVLGTAVAAGKNGQDLLVYNPVVQFTGYAVLAATPYTPALISMDSHGTWWETATPGGATAVMAQWNPAAGWTDAITGDFNGDGLTDIAARTSWGAWYVGLAKVDVGYVTTQWGAWSPSAGWNNVQTADVNGDGKADILGHAADGDWWVALSNGTSFTNQFWTNWNPAAGWSDFQVADFNGDGKADIAGMTSWGDWWVGLSTGAAFANQLWGHWNPAAGWTDIRVGDFNGDGKADIAGMTSWGDWWVASSDGTSFSNDFWAHWNPAAHWADVVVGDFNGDGKADIAGMASWGDWWVAESTGRAFTNTYWTTWNPAAGWNHVIAADVNEDTATDLVGRTADGFLWLGVSDKTKFTNQFLTYWSPALGWSPISLGRVPLF